MASYRMTPARRAALKKAQAASARKRRGKGKGKLAASNRRYDARSRHTKRALQYGAAAAAVGAGYLAVKAHSAYQRKNKAIREVKTIQSEKRRNFLEAKAGSSKIKTKVHRRALRIASSRSFHRAIIKQHTGR